MAKKLKLISLDYLKEYSKQELLDWSKAIKELKSREDFSTQTEICWSGHVVPTEPQLQSTNNIPTYLY
jgi:hypothetical protein